MNKCYVKSIIEEWAKCKLSGRGCIVFNPKLQELKAVKRDYPVTFDHDQNVNITEWIKRLDWEVNVHNVNLLCNLWIQLYNDENGTQC